MVRVHGIICTLGFDLPNYPDSNLEKHIRPFTIAKIPSLLRLDGASVSDDAIYQ